MSKHKVVQPMADEEYLLERGWMQMVWDDEKAPAWIRAEVYRAQSGCSVSCCVTLATALKKQTAADASLRAYLASPSPAIVVAAASDDAETLREWQGHIGLGFDGGIQPPPRTLALSRAIVLDGAALREVMRRMPEVSEPCVLIENWMDDLKSALAPLLDAEDSEGRPHG